jgi:hypothetical protein
MVEPWCKPPKQPVELEIAKLRKGMVELEMRVHAPARAADPTGTRDGVFLEPLAKVLGQRRRRGSTALRRSAAWRCLSNGD